MVLEELSVDSAESVLFSQRFIFIGKGILVWWRRTKKIHIRFTFPNVLLWYFSLLHP